MAAIHSALPLHLPKCMIGLVKIAIRSAIATVLRNGHFPKIYPSHFQFNTGALNCFNKQNYKFGPSISSRLLSDLILKLTKMVWCCHDCVQF